MRATIRGKVIESRKIKEDAKMFTTLVLQSGGKQKAELVEVYTHDKKQEGTEVALESFIRLSEWKDKNGRDRHGLMIMEEEKAEQQVTLKKSGGM